MAKLKVYTLGIYGFVSPAIIEAIGDRPHIRQASVYIVATSKAEAVRVAEAVGVPVWPNSSEFRQAVGQEWVESVLAYADRPMVLATSMNAPRGVVVEVEGRNQFRPIGVVGKSIRHSPILVLDGE